MIRAVIQILEDKANLAFLQLNVSVGSLETYIAASVGVFARWAECRWGAGDTFTLGRTMGC